MPSLESSSRKRTWSDDYRSTREKGKNSTHQQASIHMFFTIATVGRKKKHAKMEKPAQLNYPTPLAPQTPETPVSTKLLTSPDKHSACAFEPVTDNQAPSPISWDKNISKTLLLAPLYFRKTKNFQQMYLDLGQENFGKRTICEICGMISVHGLSEDSKEHERICQDYRQGIPFQLQRPRIVGKYECDMVVEVRPSDSYAAKAKVKRVRTIVDNDLGYNSDDLKEQRSAFLYVRNKRVVGMATVEILSKGYILDNTMLLRSNTPRKAMVGIHQLWVHRNIRKQGIGTRLVDTIRSKFIFGLVVPVEMLAFSSPTEAGATFARKYVSANACEDNCPVLIYDCT